MLVEEIARLTGTLKFNVEARPLVAFEKRLNGVMNLLREFSTLANKKFTVKVALDSKSLRAQIDRATNSKILLNNIDVSKEALALQGKRIQDHLNKTTIRLDNVRIDINKLVEQKRFIRTMMGQIQLGLPIKLNLMGMESELKRETKAIAARNPLKLEVVINQNQLVMNLRRAILQAQKNMSTLKLRVENPQVRLQVDKQHLINEIRSAINNQDFRIRIGAQGGNGRGAQGGHNPSLSRAAGQGLSTAAGFARGAIPGLGAAFAFSQMNTIQQQMQGQANAMTAVMGGEAQGREQSAWVKNLSNTVGLDYRQVAPSYNKMLASGKTSGMSTEGVQSIFQGVSEYGRVMGLDSEAMKGSMRAIEQMMNKGQVMSEELKGQLAERLPGAISAMAESAGFGTDADSVAKLFKAMENGEVKSNAVLEKFAAILAERARQGGALEKAMRSTAAEQARMNNAFTDAVMTFSAGGFDAGMASFFRTLADAMSRAEPLIKALGGAFEVLVRPLNAVFTLIGDLGEAWPDLAKSIGVSEKALATLAVAAGAFLLPFGGVLVTVSALALALEDLVTYSKGGESLFGNWVANTEGAQEAVDKIVFAFDHLKAAMADVGYAFDELKTKFPEVFDGVELDNPLVKALEAISGYVDNIASGLDRVAAVMRGDFSGAVKGLGEGYFNAITEYNPGYNLMRYAGEKGGSWLEEYRRNSGMPLNPTNTPVSLLADQRKESTPNITIPSITLQVTAPAGVTDPGDFAKGMQPHIQEITLQAVRDAFGAARAQQAERK